MADIKRDDLDQELRELDGVYYNGLDKKGHKIRKPYVTSPLAISPQLFHSKLKTLLFNKSYPKSSPSPTPQLQTPSARLCLPACLTLHLLSIEFVLIKRL